MKITIDTHIDSKEDIKRAISLLQKYIYETNGYDNKEYAIRTETQEEKTGLPSSPGMFNLFSNEKTSQTNSTNEENNDLDEELEDSEPQPRTKIEIIDL